MSNITVKDIIALKNKRKITVLTAYDYPTAAILDKAGIDIVLVGDTLANVVLGLESTTQVGMAEMLHHAKAVTRAVKNALVIGDMPYDSFQLHPEDAVKNARRFIEEAKVDAVKMEWFDKCPQVAEKIIKDGISVMGHIGLTPQTADKITGFRVQGKDAQTAKKLIEQALLLEKLGCFSIVLECVPDKLAKIITEKLNIPTISCGSGIYCDGQVLVTNDILGFFDRFKPKFAKQYINLNQIILDVVTNYKNEVIEEKFPTPEHSFTIKPEELKKLGL